MIGDAPPPIGRYLSNARLSCGEHLSVVGQGICLPTALGRSRAITVRVAREASLLLLLTVLGISPSAPRPSSHRLDFNYARIAVIHHPFNMAKTYLFFSRLLNPYLTRMTLFPEIGRQSLSVWSTYSHFGLLLICASVGSVC